MKWLLATLFVMLPLSLSFTIVQVSPVTDMTCLIVSGTGWEVDPKIKGGYL